MKAIVGSKNPVKIAVVTRGLELLFPQDQNRSVVGIDVTPGVPDQPRGSQQTLSGALERAMAARRKCKADYYVGIEGGIQTIENYMVEVAYVVVVDAAGTDYHSSTSPFRIPTKIAQMILDGGELGPASDMFFGTQNSKQTIGTIGILSDGVLDRVGLYLPAFLMAFLPHIHPEYYVKD